MSWVMRIWFISLCMLSSAAAFGWPGSPPRDVGPLFTGRQDPRMAARGYVDHFQKQQLALKNGQLKPTGKGLFVGAQAGPDPVFGADFGITKVVENGLSQLRFLISGFKKTEANGYSFRIGVNTYDANNIQRSPGEDTEAIPKRERREPVDGAALLIGAERAGRYDQASYAGLLGWGVSRTLETVEKRRNLHFPISPKWASKPMRMANKGERLAEKALAKIDAADREPSLAKSKALRAEARDILSQLDRLSDDLKQRMR